MSEQDLDLSEWLFHFIHAVTDTFLEDLQEERWQAGFHPNGIPFWSEWNWYDKQYAARQEPEWNPSPFALLQKIVHDGHIRAGWMPANGHATVFGPYPAVSLTEQCWYASGEPIYAIGVLRSELARAGGRPVIQGLHHADEATPADPLYGHGLITLSSATGIGLEEQYRYVPLVPDHVRHQGEWRWAYKDGTRDIPGLPVWLVDRTDGFTRALIIVQTANEADQILDQLKAQSDHGLNEYDYEFSRAALQNTLVLPVHKLERPHPFESPAVHPSVPAKSPLKLTPPSVSEGMLQKVKWAMVAARQAATEAVAAYERGAQRDEQGRIIGVWGRAKVVSYEPRTEITDALVQLGYAGTRGEPAYHVHTAMAGIRYGSVDAAEAGATAAADVLTLLLGQVFDITSQVD